MTLNHGAVRCRKHLVLGTLATLLFLTSASYASPSAYLYTGDEYWGTINLTTGVFTVLGNTGVKLASTGEYKGLIYGADQFGNTLYRVNAANGQLTAVGNGSISYYDLGSTTKGLYGLGDNSDLYSINPATGAATLIGPTGVSLSTTGMSNGASGLYMTVDSGADSLLYRLNTSTGKATLIGNTGVARIGALLWEGGVLYAGQASPPLGTNYLYRLNPTTGAGTFVTTTSGSETANFWGLTPISSAAAEAPVPEPSSLALLASGAVAAFAAARRRAGRREKPGRESA